MFFDSEEQAWADLEVYWNGKKISKITAIKYKKSVNKQHIHAAGDEPVDIGSGNKTYTGEMTFLAEGFSQANDEAKLSGFDDVTDMKGLSIVCKYKPSLVRPLRIDNLLGVSITDFEKTWKSGDVKGEVTLPFLFLKLA